MKILIIYQYLSFKGGIEEVILNQSKFLSEKGHTVKIATCRFHKKEANKTAANVSIFRIPSLNFTYSLFGIPFAMPIPTRKTLKKLSLLIKHADIINIHGHPYLLSFICMVLCRLYKKKVILTQHNTNIRSNSKLIDFVYRFFDNSIGKYNLNKADHIIAVSNETKKYIQSLIGKNNKISVVYNGVDTERFRIYEKKTELRKKFAIPEDIFTCLTIRRLTFKNGIETFLKAAKVSNPRKTLFLLGGSGPDLPKIEKYIAKNKISNVKLLGRVSDKELPLYYALSDVFILPSINGEGFPMVVLEAFSSGLPVIATRSGGHIEIINDEKTGYLVDVNSVTQISNRISYLSKNKKLLKEMSLNCRNLILRSLSWKQNIDNYTNLITVAA